MREVVICLAGAVQLTVCIAQVASRLGPQRGELSRLQIRAYGSSVIGLLLEQLTQIHVCQWIIRFVVKRIPKGFVCLLELPGFCICPSQVTIDAGYYGPYLHCLFELVARTLPITDSPVSDAQ